MVKLAIDIMGGDHARLKLSKASISPLKGSRPGIHALRGRRNHQGTLESAEQVKVVHAPKN